jgi:hypothetical protein
VIRRGGSGDRQPARPQGTTSPERSVTTCGRLAAVISDSSHSQNEGEHIGGHAPATQSGEKERKGERKGHACLRYHCGGPALRCRRLVERCPDGLTQVTEMVSPGRNRFMMLAKSSGDPTACPFTAVITAPPVMSAAAAGLPQIVPSIRVPELTGAMSDGTVTSALLL